MGLWFLVRTFRERGDGRASGSARVLVTATLVGLATIALSLIVGGVGHGRST